MVHEGNKVRQLARKKGFKQIDLANMRGVSKQTINNDFSRERLGIDTLKWYSNVLKVPIDEITEVDESTQKVNEIDWKEMYFQALRKIDKLTTVVLEHGIKVDLGKFEVINWHVVKQNFFVCGN